MPHFVYDNTALNFPKTNLVPLPPGANPSQWVAEDDWNILSQAVVDLRDTVRNAKYFGFDDQSSDPNPIAHTTSWLWVRQSDGQLIHRQPGGTSQEVLYESRQILTAPSSGLDGGGPLTTDLNLTLKVLGSSNTYANPSSITVDQYGRVTAATAGTGTSPGGANTQVQFNDGGVFGGDAHFTWNKTTNLLVLSGGTGGNSGLRLEGGNLEINADGGEAIFEGNLSMFDSDLNINDGNLNINNGEIISNGGAQLAGDFFIGGDVAERLITFENVQASGGITIAAEADAYVQVGFSVDGSTRSIGWSIDMSGTGQFSGIAGPIAQALASNVNALDIGISGTGGPVTIGSTLARIASFFPTGRVGFFPNAGTVTYLWPAAHASGALTNDGSGGLSWTAVSGGVAEPANQVVYGTGSGVDSSPKFTFDPTTSLLGITNTTDTTLNIQMVGSGQVRFKTDLAGRWLSFADGAGTTDVLSVRSGRVGVGDSNPQYPLDVNTSAAGQVARFRNTASDGSVLHLQATNANSYTNIIFFNDSGSVKAISGLGNSSAGYAPVANKYYIELYSGIDFIVLQDAVSTPRFKVTRAGLIGIAGLDYTFPASHVTNGFLKNNGSGTLVWETVSSGVSEPNTQIVYGTGSGVDSSASLTYDLQKLVLQHNNTGTRFVLVRGASVPTLSSDLNMMAEFHTTDNAINWLFNSSSGATVDYNIHFGGAGTWRGVKNLSGANYIAAVTAGEAVGSEAIVFRGGKVGLGQINPAQVLELNGNIALGRGASAGAFTRIVGVGGVSGTFVESTTGGSWIKFNNKADGSNDIEFVTHENAVQNAVVARFDISGNLELLKNLDKIRNVDYVWPAANAAGVLTNNGTGSLSWAAVTPAGADTQVQFNDGGVFGGDASFTWDKTNNVLALDNQGLSQASMNGNTGLRYQSTTTNANAYFGMVPNGTGTNATLAIYGSSDVTTNIVRFSIGRDGSSGGFYYIVTDKAGSGAQHALRLGADGVYPPVQLVLGTNGNVAVGSATATSLFNVGASQQFQVTSAGKIAMALGNVGSTNGISMTGTLDDNGRGLVFTLATSGTSTPAPSRIGIQMLLNAGFTGTGTAAAGDFECLTAGTGNDLKFNTSFANPAGNSGINGFAAGTTTGLNVGGYYEAANGNLNIGVVGKTTTAKNAATNIGMLGVARNTGTTPIEIGGYFGLHNATPTFETAALIADNGSIAASIFKGRDNGTTVFEVGDGGDLVKIKGVSYVWPSANATGVLTNDGSGGLSWTAATAGAAGSDTQIQYNNGGVLGGATTFTFDDTTGKVTISGAATPHIFSVVNNQSGNVVMRVRNTHSSGYSLVQFADNADVGVGAVGYANGGVVAPYGGRMYIDKLTSTDFAIIGNAEATQAVQFIVKGGANNGRVGVGTDNPSFKLQVAATASVPGIGVTGLTNGVGGLAISNSVDSSWYITTVGSGQIRQATEAAGRWMSFASGDGTVDHLVVRNGGVGIGETNPSSNNKLTVVSTDTAANRRAVVIKGAEVGNRVVDITNTNSQGGWSGIGFWNTAFNAVKLDIGYVNTGHPNSFYANFSGRNIIAGDGSTDLVIGQQTASNPFAGVVHMMVKAATGRVGIGTDAPDTLLHVAGNALISGTAFPVFEVRNNQSGNEVLKLYNQNAAGYSSIDFSNNSGSEQASFGYANASASNATVAGKTFWTKVAGVDAVIGETTAQLIIKGTTGRVGVGEAAPAALFSVGTSSPFQVNNSGDIIKIKNVTYSWPSADAAGVLTSDGGGNLSWSAAGTGTVTGTGTAGRIAYWSSSSALTSDADLTFDGTILSIGSQGLFQSATVLGGLTGLVHRSQTTDARSLVALAPNGTSTLADFVIFNTSDITTNWSQLGLGFDSSTNRFAITTNKGGTGTVRPLVLAANSADNGLIQLYLDTTGRVGIGTASPTARLHVVHTHSATPGADVDGVIINVTSAGSQAFAQRAGTFTLGAGYTGASNTAVFNLNNLVVGGTGKNYGTWSYAGEGNSTGTFIGLRGTGGNQNGSGVQIGGFFDLGTGTIATPTVSGALIASNGTTTDSIFIGLDNATVVFQVADGGDLTKIRGVTYSWPSAIGSTGQVLKIQNAGTGQLEWAADSTGATVSEPANQIVYGTGSGVDSSSNFMWDPTTGNLSIEGPDDLTTLLNATTDDDGEAHARIHFSYQDTLRASITAEMDTSGNDHLLEFNVHHASGAIALQINATTQLRITGTETRSANDLFPDSDNTYDLGSDSLRWKLIRGVTITAGDIELGYPDSAGEWIFREGPQNIYAQNKRDGKKYKLLMEEVVDGEYFPEPYTPGRPA